LTKPARSIRAQANVHAILHDVDTPAIEAARHQRFKAYKRQLSDNIVENPEP
jgi:hypothetical protein